MNRRPRVLRVLNRLNIGGPVVSAAYLTRRMEPDFETLLVAGPPDRGEAAAIDICQAENVEPMLLTQMRRSIHPLRDVHSMQAMRRLIREYRPDIVHTHAAKAGLIGRLAAALEGVPLRVHTFEGHVFHSYFGPLRTRAFISIEQAMARMTHRIVAVSESQRRELTESYRIAPPDRFRVVRNGYDLSRFMADQASLRTEFRRQLCIDESTVAIGVVGRFAPIKNHRLFLEAFANLSKRPALQVVGVMVGDGELNGELRRQAEQLSLPVAELGQPAPIGGLLFTSWVSDVAPIYAGLDMVALSSRNEGNPVTLIEAQAAMKPVVSTNVGGVSDTVAKDITGILTPPDNPAALADALAALALDAEKRRVMGQAGRAFVLKHHELGTFIETMKAVYWELIEEYGL